MDNSVVSLQDILFEGENILWEGKPDKFCYVTRIAKGYITAALAFLIFDGFFIFIMSSFAQEIPKEAIIFLVGFFAFHLLPVWLLVGNVIKALASHKNIVYAITDKRIITRQGLVGLDFNNINYSDISNISVDVSVLEKMRNSGTLYLKTSSKEFISLSGISEPYKVYKIANKVFMDMNADIHFPNALRPGENPGYNTKYTGQ